MEIAFKDIQRFHKFIKIQDGCWIFTGRTLRGYGYFSIKGDLILAHRFSYLASHGTIPFGKQLDHLCRNRSCVNPAHLEAVTGRVNCLRGNGPTAVNARKTDCVNGHTFSKTNTHKRFRNGYWVRACRQCWNDYYENNRSKILARRKELYHFKTTAAHKVGL